MARIGLKLREAVKNHGVQTATEIFRAGLEERKFRREDVSLREMAESLIGENWKTHLGRYKERLRENSAAVDASGFSAITGQLLVDTVVQKYKMATMVGDKIFDVQKVTNGNLGTYKEPWLGDVVDEPAMVQQQMPYPRTQFGPQYREYPAPQKFGRICAVTFEMIYSDLTKQALDSASSVGRRTGLWVEKQKLRCVAGVTNNHSWNGTAYNTFLTTGAWVNKLTDFTFTNWTSVERVEQLFAEMTDPVTGEPIDIEGYQLLTVPKLKYTARRVLNATETRSGDITTGDGHQVVAGNPIEESYELLVSKHLRKLLVAATGGTTQGAGLTAAVANTVTFFGDLKKAFVWREVFPHKVEQAPPQHPADFEQDIVLQVKSSVYGVACVRDPRYVVWAYNSSAT